MRRLMLLALVLVGCGDGFVESASGDGPCVVGYEQRDYYPRTAVWCGPVGSDAGVTNFNPCRNGRPVSWAGGGVVQCEYDAGH